MGENGLGPGNLMKSRSRPIKLYVFAAKRTGSTTLVSSETPQNWNHNRERG